MTVTLRPRPGEAIHFGLCDDGDERLMFAIPMRFLWPSEAREIARRSAASKASWAKRKAKAA